jgi:hypothetical protein
MREIYLIGLTVLISLSAAANRPIYIKVKHVKGVHGLEMSYLQSKEGKGAGAGYFTFPANRVFLAAGAEFERGKVGFTDFIYFNARTKANLNIFDVKNKYYFNIFASGKAGAELLQLSNKLPDLYRDENNFSMQAGIGLLNEFFITSKIILTVSCEQILFAKSVLGRQNYNAQIGIFYILN